MSLKNLLSKATKIALDSLSDLNESGSFYDKGNLVIDVFTETVSPATAKTIEILTYSYKESDIDGVNIRRTDLKGVLHSSSLPTGYIPALEDEVSVSGVKYSVVNIRKPPGGSVLFLQLRAS